VKTTKKMLLAKLRTFGPCDKGYRLFQKNLKTRTITQMVTLYRKAYRTYMNGIFHPSTDILAEHWIWLTVEARYRMYDYATPPEEIVRRMETIVRGTPKEAIEALMECP
jgi:hypothetical protein